MSEYDQINEHLERSDKNFIDVMDYKVQQYIDKRLFLSDIKDQYGSLDNYLKTFISKKIQDLQFYLRKTQGSGSRLAGGVLNVRIKPEEQEVQEVNEPQKSFPPAQVAQQPAAVHYPNGQSIPMNGAFPMQNTGEVFILQKQMAYLEKQNRELEDDRKKYKKKADDFREQRDELKSQVRLAEAEKLFALKEAALNSKGFFDSETGQTLVTEGLGIAAQLVESKKESSQQFLASPALNEKFSEYKKALIMSIEPDEITDEACVKLYFTLQGLNTNEAFKTEHQSLLDKHNLKSQ